MKKGIILIGSIITDINRMSKLLMDGKKSVTIDGRQKDLFKNACCWSKCDLDTEVIYIEDLKDMRVMDILCNAITEPIIVNKQCLKPFFIHPSIIISCTNKISDIPKGVRYDRRFDIFELKSCNNNSYSLNK